MFQGNDYLHPVKLCTAFVNMAVFVNRGLQRVALKLSGDAVMLKFEILMEEATAEQKNAGDDSDVDEEEAKKKAEAKLAQSGPDDKKKQKNQEVMQELAPNPELARRNKELEDRLRDVTVDAENLKY
jgi:hypothetical protein